MNEHRKREIRREADRIRERCRVGRYGITDLFQECEWLDYKLIRYPAGEQSDLGFCTFRDGDVILFTNSCSRLSREIFTLAHEIGHAVLHTKRMLSFVDNDETISGKSTEEPEMEANHFAACLLMPEEIVDKFLASETDYEGKEGLSALDIARMMSEFQVSFDMALFRLENLGKISHDERIILENEKTQSRVGNLLKIVGGNSRLNEQEKRIYIPYEYLSDVIFNYNHLAVPEDNLKRVLDIYHLTMDDISDQLVSVPAESGDDLDELIEAMDG